MVDRNSKFVINFGGSGNSIRSKSIPNYESPISVEYSGTSVFTPLDRGADLVQWLHGQKGTIISSSISASVTSSFLQTWEDQSGNARDMSNTSSLSKPTYSGSSAVFSGSHHLRSFGAFAAGTISAPYTVYTYVDIHDHTTTFGRIYASDINNTVATAPSLFVDISEKVYLAAPYSAASLTSSVVNLTGSHIIAALINKSGSLSELYVDDMKIASNIKDIVSGGVISTYDSLSFGDRHSQPFYGRIMHHVVVKGFDDHAKRGQMATYLENATTSSAVLSKGWQGWSSTNYVSAQDLSTMPGTGSGFMRTVMFRCDTLITGSDYDIILENIDGAGGFVMYHNSSQNLIWRIDNASGNTSKTTGNGYIQPGKTYIASGIFDGTNVSLVVNETNFGSTALLFPWVDSTLPVETGRGSISNPGNTTIIAIAASDSTFMSASQAIDYHQLCMQVKDLTTYTGIENLYSVKQGGNLLSDLVSGQALVESGSLTTVILDPDFG